MPLIARNVYLANPLVHHLTAYFLIYFEPGYGSPTYPHYSLTFFFSLTPQLELS